LATLFRIHLRPILWFQIGIVMLYSLIISIWLPEQWAHPFGPMSKNLPMLVATFILLVLERRQ
jgi:hypothetical protein